VRDTRYIMRPPFLVPNRMERMRLLYKMIKEPEILHRKRPRAVQLAKQQDARPSLLCASLLDLDGRPFARQAPFGALRTRGVVLGTLGTR